MNIVSVELRTALKYLRCNISVNKSTLALNYQIHPKLRRKIPRLKAFRVPFPPSLKRLAQLSTSIMDNNVASKLPVAAMSAGAVLTQRADLAKGSLSLLKIHLDMLAPL